MSDERTLATEIRELFQAVGQQGTRSTAEGWARHFKVQVGSNQFYYAIGNVERNIQQLIADIQASKLKAGSKALYVNAANSLLHYVSLQGMLNTHAQDIASNDRVFEYLTLVDDFLPSLDHREIEQETIDNLRIQIRELIGSLDEAEIDNRLRIFIRGHLINVLWALDHYAAVGIDGICRIFGAAHAEIARSAGFRGASKSGAQSWFSKAWPALGIIGMTITTASAVVEDVDNLLTHGTGIYNTLTGNKPENSNTDVDVSIITQPQPSAPALPSPEGSEKT